jgi:hypothetical protein
MTLEQQFELAKVIIAAVGVIGGGISVVIALLNAQHKKRKTRYEFFRDLYQDFLSPEILQKRNAVAQFWRDKVYMPPTVTSIRPEVSELSNIPDARIRDYFERSFNTIIETIDDKFVNDHHDNIKETEYILNRYEHLAKLVELRVISEKEVKTFFYTMLADTFVICLPFILYRRAAKPSYAHKMQGLLQMLPNLSLDLSRV